MANFIVGIITLSISVVILASVFITTLKGTNTTYVCDVWNGTAYNVGSCTWTASEIALWGLITLVSIAGMLYGVMNVFGIN